MPVTPTFPGVYIQEIPSGVRTITGVATSITALIGSARRGPVNAATTINSFSDFERIFGGVWTNSALGYSVRDFYQNGGGQAIIVRLYNGSGGESQIVYTTVTVQAADPGSWGDTLRIRVDHDVSAVFAASIGLADTDLFNLWVTDTRTGELEFFRNLTTKESPRRADRVLALESRMIRWKAPALPSATRPNKHADPPAGKQWFEDDTSSAKVTTAGSDGGAITEGDFTSAGAKKGLFALEQADLVNLICIPPFQSADNSSTFNDAVAVYAESRRAVYLIDPPDWVTKDAAKTGIATVSSPSKNAAVFFPRIRRPNAEKGGLIENFAPSGAVAGVFARTDGQRGVWKAPAGLDATLSGVPELSVNLTDPENGELNPLGVNCLRSFPAAGRVVWGSRTRVGDDRLASEWKYIPVRRTALFIEESLYRGTQWVVFEPNDEPLWAQIRLNVGSFMNSLFRQGAFQGKTPQEAYLVKCDKETTTQDDINKGIVNIVVGFAPLKPAEFVIIKIQQLAGQIAV